MKLIVVILAVLAVSVYAENEAESKELQEKCLNENSISAEKFIAEKDTDTASMGTKCTLACIYGAYLNEDGSVNMDKVASKLGENQEMFNAIKECSASAPKGNKCQVVFEIMKCLRNKHIGKGGP